MAMMSMGLACTKVELIPFIVIVTLVVVAFVEIIPHRLPILIHDFPVVHHLLCDLLVRVFFKGLFFDLRWSVISLRRCNLRTFRSCVATVGLGDLLQALLALATCVWLQCRSFELGELCHACDIGLRRLLQERKLLIVAFASCVVRSSCELCHQETKLILGKIREANT